VWTKKKEGKQKKEGGVRAQGWAENVALQDASSRGHSSVFGDSMRQPASQHQGEEAYRQICIVTAYAGSRRNCTSRS
jgi:hypothetical protein